MPDPGYEPQGMAPGRLYTLHPGDVACAEQGDTLETLLGSCVAVILTDRKRTVATMCHIVHPSAMPSRGKLPTTSADGAIDAMYRLLTARGMSPRLCRALVYGGGNMFPDLYRDPHVGEQNYRAALARLEADGVRIDHYDVGGAVYRRLRWTVGALMPDCIAQESDGASS